MIAPAASGVVADHPVSRSRRRTLLSLLAAPLAACLPMRDPVVPMTSIIDRLPGSLPVSARTLIVMLPGARDEPADLVREGFVAAVRERRIAADVQIVDAHVAYYMRDLIEVRLREDVIAPARRQGYAAIWLAGISIGAVGAFVAARDNPDAVTGIIALAPFLGPDELRAEVEGAGGLAAWQPGPIASDDHLRPLLQWLQGYRDPAARRPPLYLGYGRDDRFARFDAMLGALLPPARVATTAGGHDWAPWQRLWRDMLDRAPLSGDFTRKARHLG